MNGLPTGGDPVWGLEIKRAMEDVIGKQTDIECVQKCNGNWRLILWDPKDRALLLTTGISIRGFIVTLLGRNPNHINGKEGVRLILSNIPYSISNEEVVKGLHKIGVTVGSSELKWEQYKDENRKMLGTKTGRRFVLIEPPLTPLPTSFKVAGFANAYLSYKGMKKKEFKETPGYRFGHESESQSESESETELKGKVDEDKAKKVVKVKKAAKNKGKVVLEPHFSLASQVSIIKNTIKSIEAANQMADTDTDNVTTQSGEIGAKVAQGSVADNLSGDQIQLPLPLEASCPSTVPTLNSIPTDEQISAGSASCNLTETPVTHFDVFEVARGRSRLHESSSGRKERSESRKRPTGTGERKVSKAKRSKSIQPKKTPEQPSIPPVVAVITDTTVSVKYDWWENKALT